MNKLTLVFSLLVVFVLASCENGTTQTSEAVKTTITDLKKEPALGWFVDEVNNYKPDSVSVKSIENGYNASTDKFILFVKTTCSCVGTTKQFPAFIKSVQSAGINESNMEIYKMTSNSDKNPYSDKIKLNDLPRFFLVRNGVIKYSIIDTLEYKAARDPKNVPTIESLIVESLK